MKTLRLVQDKLNGTLFWIKSDGTTVDTVWRLTAKELTSLRREPMVMDDLVGIVESNQPRHFVEEPGLKDYGMLNDQNMDVVAEYSGAFLTYNLHYARDTTLNYLGVHPILRVGVK